MNWFVCCIMLLLLGLGPYFICSDHFLVNYCHPRKPEETSQSTKFTPREQIYPIPQHTQNTDFFLSPLPDSEKATEHSVYKSKWQWQARANNWGQKLQHGEEK